MKINVNHIYKCQWDQGDYIFFNYIKSVTEDTFTGEAITGTHKDYPYLSKQIIFDADDYFCGWDMKDIEEAVVFEDMGTYEEFINNYPELLI